MCNTHQPRGLGPGMARTEAAWTTLAAAGLGAVIAWHVWQAPYTKVEESFSLQAVHDILTYGVSPSVRPQVRDPLTQYDHHTFPGAVPRSFLPPLVLAGVCAPGAWAVRLAGGSAADVQQLVRFVLGAAAWGALVIWARCVLRTPAARGWFYALCGAQFHVPFWASRTTPNSLVFPWVTAALGAVLRGRPTYGALAVLAAVTTACRLELVGLVAPAYLYAWLAQRRSFWRVFVVSALSSLGGIVLSVAVDSYFWQRAWLWPEGHAIFFNVVEGHSAAWGVSPLWTYYLRDVPRLLGVALPWVLVGSARRSPLRVALLALALSHVTLLSALAHKEWRFVVYTVPLFNALAALGLEAASRRAWGAALGVATLGAGAALAGLGAYISARNYPGGEALAALHARAPGPAHVHIDTLSAMTGVSLFQSTHLARPASSLVPSALPAWVYDKSEPRRNVSYTHLLDETGCAPGFRALGAPLLAYAGRRWASWRSYLERVVSWLMAPRLATVPHLLPFDVLLAPAVWVCERYESAI